MWNMPLCIRDSWGKYKRRRLMPCTTKGSFAYIPAPARRLPPPEAKYTAPPFLVGNFSTSPPVPGIRNSRFSTMCLDKHGGALYDKPNPYLLLLPAAGA